MLGVSCLRTRHFRRPVTPTRGWADMQGTRAQAGQEHTRQDDASRVGSGLSRRDVLLNLGRWTASAAGMALLGGCQLVSSPAATIGPIGRTQKTIGYISPGADDHFNDLWAYLAKYGWVRGENLNVLYYQGNINTYGDLAAKLVAA